MKEPSERDPFLRLIDAVLGDLAVRSAMYIGRRREDGDDESFVIQTGEDGRLRLGLPDRASDASIGAVVAEAQAYLGEVLGAPVPLCPRHQHALVGVAAEGRLTWVCPEGSWQCALGDYEELTWPQDDVASLAPILARRLKRRGVTGVVTISVGRTKRGLVAEFGVAETGAELMQTLRDAAAPLPVALHRETRRVIRVGPLPQ
jgi:hypothetical protein